MQPREIAAKLAGQDMAKRKRLRSRIRHMIRNDPKFAVAVGVEARAQMLTDLGPATTALGKRAKRGRPDAIKLLYEASGFHNPKVQHEHSGDIKITLDIPRPPKRVDADIADADVIED